MKAKINGIDMGYTDQGSGTPVVFVHGFPLNKSMWEEQVKGLSSQHRVIAMDLRGHGESESASGAYTMDLLADDVKGLLDHLRLDRVVLVGFSMGGYAAFAFYRKYANRVRALVLADTRPQPDSPEAKQGRETTAQTALRDGVKGIAQGLSTRMLAPATVQGKPDLVKKVLDIMTSTPVNGYVGDLHALAQRPDSTPTLSQITCPTLIIVGDQDAVTPPADSRLMQEQIKGSKLATIAGAGHLSPIEQPEAFNKALSSFLSTL